jgi:hypothetical protein
MRNPYAVLGYTYIGCGIRPDHTLKPTDRERLSRLSRARFWHWSRLFNPRPDPTSRELVNFSLKWVIRTTILLTFYCAKKNVCLYLCAKKRVFGAWMAQRQKWRGIQKNVFAVTKVSGKISRILVLSVKSWKFWLYFKKHIHRSPPNQQLQTVYFTRR